MKRALSLAAKLVVTAALLGWAVHQASGQDLVRVAASIEPAWVAAALATQLLITVPLTVRWRIVAGRLAIGVPFVTGWRLVMIGQFFNQTLPSSVGGDAVRIWMLSRVYRKPLNEATTSMLADRLLALVSVPVFAVLGIVLVPEFFRKAEVAWVIWPLIAAVLLGAAAVRRIDLLPTWPGLRRSELFHQVSKASAALRMLSHDRAAGGVGLCLSLAISAGVGVSVWLLSRSVGLAMDLPTLVVMTPVVLLAAIIPVTISGWGLRESVMVAAFAHLGADPSLVFATSVLYGLTMIVVGLPGGALWVAGRVGARRVGRAQPVADSSSSTSTTSSSGT